MTTWIMKQTIKHFTQPNGISCGPTCIMMAYEALPNVPKRKHYSILEISDLCGTDSIVGTPPERLEKGLDALNMYHVHHVNSPEPFKYLKLVIDNGNLPILRTFTHGIPHWIIVSNYDDDLFYVNDPWQGEITYSQEQLNNVWVGRNYEFYEIQMLIIKRGITPNQLEQIIPWSFHFFNKIIGNLEFKTIVKRETDLDKSIILIDKDERILGTYLIGNSQLQHPDYENLKGVEGVLLAVDDSLRGHGWGSRMKDYPKTLGVDYIWGYQATGLNNLNEWLKRRELIAESELVYVTAEKYDKRKH
jgi:Peptidase C39 family